MRNNIDDDKLFEFLCDILNDSKIKFIKQIESVDLYNKELKLLNNDCFKEVIVDESSIKSHKYKLKLSSILRNFISLEKKPNRVQLIKARKYVLQKLWTYFVRNAIKLLRQYDRRDLGELKFDFGVKNLTDYFEEFSIFEELLYGLDDYYRDHTLHVFRVYLLGDFIIRTHIPGGYEEITIFDQPREIKIKNNEKEAMWCIIALCHDLGYPLERIDNLNKKLIKILDYFGTSHFQRVRYSLPFEGAILDKFILKLLSSKLEKINDSEFKTNIQTKFYTKFSNAYEKLSHGMMSCVLLMKNLVYFKESDFKVVFKNNTNPKDNNNKKIII